jgi:hypothetical protein
MATPMEARPEARPRTYHGTSMARGQVRGATPGWDLGPDRRIDDGETLASALGWFSVALGAVELLAAEEVCEILGMDGQEGLVRLYGVREVVKGAGILSRRRPKGWIFGRVAGDILDLATLGANLPDNRRRRNVLVAMGAVAGVMALDLVCARQLTRRR